MANCQQRELYDQEYEEAAIKRIQDRFEVERQGNETIIARVKKGQDSLDE